MDSERRLDAHLASAVDELLSLASLASASGRPELALGASAAFDQLAAFLVAVRSDPRRTPGEWARRGSDPGYS